MHNCQQNYCISPRESTHPFIIQTEKIEILYIIPHHPMLPIVKLL